MNALGYPGNETTRQYFKDLVSFSKKICSFRYKKNTVFEGMYGFVGKEYFDLVNPWCCTYYPYHWQCLKTQPTIIGNEDNPYSRANAINYVETNNLKLYTTLAPLPGFHCASFASKMRILNI